MSPHTVGGVRRRSFVRGQEREREREREIERERESFTRNFP
jgi:hypothetical protein